MSEFTDDPDTVNIIDGISHVKQSRVYKCQKRTCLVVVESFEANINQTWYIYNREWLSDQFIKVIDDPLNISPERMAAFHLIFHWGYYLLKNQNTA